MSVQNEVNVVSMPVLPLSLLSAFLGVLNTLQRTRKRYYVACCGMNASSVVVGMKCGKSLNS